VSALVTKAGKLSLEEYKEEKHKRLEEPHKEYREEARKMTSPPHDLRKWSSREKHNDTDLVDDE
jgi:hypothetical protein